MPFDTEEGLSAALHDAVGHRPFQPDLDRIVDRGRTMKHRRLAWRATAGTAFVAVAAVAVAVATSGPGAQAPARTVAAPNPTASASASAKAEPPLLQLAGYLTTIKSQPGDAALVLRDQRYSSGLKVDVYDLYADNGKYYFAKNRSGLPAKVRAGKTEGGDLFRREVAAAKYAATGDLAKARVKMATAPSPSTKLKDDLGPGVVPSLPPTSKKLPKDLLDFQRVNTTDNWVWENSMDALNSGAGSPTVRAGVLRLLSTLPEVKVTNGTLNGVSTLTLTAGKPALPGAYTEAVTINATTGVPIKFVGGKGSVIVNYKVTRVTLADVAKGKF